MNISNISRYVLGMLMTVAGFTMLLLPRLGLFDFANLFTQRLFTFLSLVIIIIGFTFTGSNVNQMALRLVLTSILVFGFYFIFGGILIMNDAINGTSVASGNVWIAFDSLVDTAIAVGIIVNLVIMVVPVANLIVSIIAFWYSDTTDDFVTAGVEAGLSLAFILIYGFAGFI